MSARNVLVVMPFGSGNPIEHRRAILNFKRLEYLVRNRCQVKSVGSTDSVVYGVQVAKTAMGATPNQVLQQIQNADILIALVTEISPNVIYEVAYRRAKNRTVVLVVDSPDNLPLYLKPLAYHSWKQDEVLAQIEIIAKNPANIPDLPDFGVGIPNDLREAIDRYDGVLENGLEQALQKIEMTIGPQPDPAVRYLRGIISDETISFYPSSIVEITFSKRNEFDPKQPAIVQDFDDKFSRLYGYLDKRGAEADRPLTFKKLLEQIEKWSTEGDWKEFMKEQMQLTNTVIKEYGFARASIPLQFNEKHPHSDYRNKSYLPSIIAEVIDGKKEGEHKMYLLVVYIEIPDTLK